MIDSVTAAIASEDTYSSALSVTAKGFNLSISGSFVATVTVQRSFDGGSNWHDVESYAAPVEDVGEEPVGCLYRVGVKSGNYTSGTVNVRLEA